MSEGTEGTVNDGAVDSNLLTPEGSGASCGCGCGDSAAGEGNDGHEGHGADAGSHGYTPDKKRYLARLKRIEGQVRGLHRMVDEDTYCIDVLTQVTAVQSALKSVALALLDDHMQHCVLHAAQQGEEEAMEKLDEVSAAVARLVR
ncbi:MAG: metal-sensitive transcriptional regulator [Candidatus Corynebacterium faecigallinarum]|uniref:metal-sensitive transcriptional regulator n=1 Tax=Candidatus Corynebacterium faecigallinarum TaxID=2838528 RepID=UPI003FB8DEC0